MKLRVASLAVACATVIYAQIGAPGYPPGAVGGVLMRGVPEGNAPGARGNGGGGAKNLLYHKGNILPGSTVYFIEWGNFSSCDGTGSNQNQWPCDANSGLASLIAGFSSSATQPSTFMSDIFPQYLSNSNVVGGLAAPVSVALFNTPGSSLPPDSSTPPSNGPSVSTIVSEACKVITHAGLAPNPKGLYVVLTSNFPSGTNYCAWHSYGTCNGTTIQVAYMPNTTGVSGCNDPKFSCNGYTPGTQSIANIVSHEFSEAITDPDLNAWYDVTGSEIGDKCAWTFASCVNLPNGSWQLQREWSNAISACQQQ